MTRIYLAAKMQAYLLAYAKEHPHETFTVADVVTHAEVKRMQAQDHHVISGLDVLRKAGYLERVRMGVGRARYGYTLPLSQKPKASPPTETSLPDGIKVILTKSGNLRVSFKGIAIEIGVEQ